MNIFHKVTPAKYEKNRTRTLVTILGVILSAAMITAVASFAISLQQYMVKELSRNTAIGRWHFWILMLLSLKSKLRIRMF